MGKGNIGRCIHSAGSLLKQYKLVMINTMSTLSSRGSIDGDASTEFVFYYSNHETNPPSNPVGTRHTID